MQAVADPARERPRLRDDVRDRTEETVDGGSPAVRARGRELLETLASAD